MNSLKTYISSVFLILFLFPVLGKLVHHLSEDHENDCHKKEIHYCNSDHDCAICAINYSAFTSTAIQKIHVTSNSVEKPFIQDVNSIQAESIRSFFLRGPPHFG